jgi:hypothetical protein
MQEGASDGSFGVLPLYCTSLQLHCFAVLSTNLEVACAVTVASALVGGRGERGGGRASSVVDE